jgi:hypothetical protein
MQKTILISLIVLMLFGCVSTKNYEGPTRPQTEVSEIYLRTIVNVFNLHVTSINGDNEEYLYYKRMNVLPGNKTIKLTTSPLINEDEPFGKEYIGKSTISFLAKKGKTYTFSVPSVTYTMHQDSQVCIHEENWDDPDSKVGLTREFRFPSKNAIEIACMPIKYIERN